MGTTVRYLPLAAVVAAAAIAAGRLDMPRSEAPAAAAGSRGEPVSGTALARSSGSGPTSAAAAGNISAYYRRLLELGLAADETKPLLLAQLEQHAGRALAAAPFRYWLPGGGATAADAARRLEAGDAMRAALQAVYGGAAAEEPSFRRLFRPLDERLGFLTSEQQIRLVRARVDARARARGAGLTRAPNAVAPGAEAPRAAPIQAEPDRAALAAFLDDRLLFEYELRESGLAEQLRNAGIEFSEAEFRETFSLLTALTRTPTPETYRRVRSELRALLGTERFDRLWAERDPVYAIVRELMGRRGYSEATILAAYGVVNRAQDALAEAAAIAARDPLRSIERTREISAREERELADLVGPDLSQQILTARAQGLFELSRRASFDTNQEEEVRR